MKRRIAAIVLAGAALAAGCGPTIASAPEPQEGQWVACVPVTLYGGQERCLSEWHQQGPDEPNAEPVAPLG